MKELDYPDPGVIMCYTFWYRKIEYNAIFIHNDMREHYPTMIIWTENGTTRGSMTRGSVTGGSMTGDEKKVVIIGHSDYLFYDDRSVGHVTHTPFIDQKTYEHIADRISKKYSRRGLDCSLFESFNPNAEITEDVNIL